MITTGNLSNYQNAIYDISVSVDSPLSGFELSLSETGEFYSSDLITFSGKEGYVFDQSGNFFGGYRSGISFDLEVHHDYINNSFSYYQDGVLIANGLDVTGQTQGATDKSVNCLIFNKHGDSEVSLSVSGQSQNSLAKNANSQINNNITSTMNVSSNASMLTSFTDPNGVLEGGGFNAPRSESFWAKDIDFTSVSVWNNKGYGTPTDYRQRGATAITKRHVIMAKHFKLSASDVVYFADPNGTWVSRTISAVADHASADITVGVLSEELPDNISFAKILPLNINDFLKTSGSGILIQYYQPIVAGFDFEKKLILGPLVTAKSSIRETLFYSAPSDVPEPYRNLAEQIGGGDSGQPVFIIINGEAVLLTTYLSVSGSLVKGPSFAYYSSDINDLIAQADSNASLSTSLKATEFDLDPLVFFKF